MKNSHYDLELTAKITYELNDELEFVDIEFDPYEYNDLVSLKALSEESLPEDAKFVSVEITDFGDVPKDYANDKKVFEFATAFAECSYEIEVVEAALDCGVEPSDIDEAYQGEFKSDEDFARSIAEELGLINKNAKWPYTCIDWGFAAKELMYDYSESNRHYFRDM